MTTKRVTVRHAQAVWEYATFPVDAPDPLPEPYTSITEWMESEGNTDELMSAASDRGELHVKVDGTVEGMDWDLKEMD